MSNKEFFEQYAGPATVGLVGSRALIDRSIRQAQRKITGDGKRSPFSHAFLIGEKRADDCWWVIESDLEIHRRQVKLGVQENRIDKYFDDALFPNIAILDFALDEAKARKVLKAALDLVAGRAHYSLGEVLGVMLSFGSEEKRKAQNRFSKENAFICSSFVQHCYGPAGVVFSERVSARNITPEDIFSTALPHKREYIIREK